MSNKMGYLLLHRYQRALGLALVCLLLVFTAGSAAAVNDVVIDGTMTDWADEVCRSDAGGANDASGTRDLTRICIANNYSTTQPATIVYVRMDFDDTNFSGSSSADSCANFDTDGDGNVDRALCTTVENATPTITFVTLYSCNDSKTDRCAGSSALTFTGSCALQVTTNTNPYDSGSDTAIECAIPVAEIGMTSIVRTNICSYASQQPNSSPADCALASTRLYTNVTTGISGETSPTAITLLAFGGTSGSTDLLWPGLAAALALLGALALARGRRRAAV